MPLLRFNVISSGAPFMKRKETSPSIDLFSEQRILEALSQFTLVELKLKDAIP